MERNQRYERHYSLKGFGEEGQRRLSAAAVIVIGAGGLGCPALQYLVAAGVGRVALVDHDTVALSNLQRQVVFSTADIGRSKAEVAGSRLKALNPEIEIIIHPTRITTDNALELIAGYDVVIDCTDNFTTRYMLGDASMLMNKPLVFGAIYQYEGQVAIFNVPDEQGHRSTYRHLFPEPPQASEAPDCNDAGVLGVLPGTIGTMQAAETIKLLTGVGKALINKMMTISLLDYRTFVLDIPHELPKEARIPESPEAFKQMDYAHHCGFTGAAIKGVSPEELLNLCREADALVIDVRELHETPRLAFPHLPVPLARLTEKLDAIRQDRLIVVCQSGVRSLAGARLLQDRFGSTKQIGHLEGGVRALQTYEDEKI